MPFTTKIGPTTTMTQLIVIPDATLNGAGVVTLAKISSLAGGVTSLAPVGSSPNADAATLTGSVLNLEPASDSQPGVMSAADKTKLDSLPSGPLPPPGGTLDWAMFYGLTAGTGNAGPTDYATTIAVRTANGTGHVPFPRLGPAKPSSGITAGTAGLFNLANAGTYEVNFRCHTTEPGQLELVVNNSLLPETCFANMNPTAGGHEISGSVLITVGAGSVLEVVNPNGNTPALTITPADGSSTHANAQVLTIKQVA